MQYFNLQNNELLVLYIKLQYYILVTIIDKASYAKTVLGQWMSPQEAYFRKWEGQSFPF